jgi:hypothetical protein
MPGHLTFYVEVPDVEAALVQERRPRRSAALGLPLLDDQRGAFDEQVEVAAALPSLEETEGEFAVRMNALRSSSPREPEGTFALERKAAERRPRRRGCHLKVEPGQDLLIYGSGQLVNSLHPHGIIDEYRLMERDAGGG